MTLSSRHVVIATAGHIDHGKTALVKALTGMDTDRLEEEKRRGVTIELGFAFLGDQITIIDVPGHERFIKTMAAGVSTVDLALLVVAADDGVMPQTREHLAILDLLGIPQVFIVLTKTEGVDREWLDLVEAEIADLLPPRYTQNPRFFECDSISGTGVESLKNAILEFSKNVQPRYDCGVFRLPVDRVFSLRGYGTVVTGTILGGEVRVGDRLAVMPQGIEVRVRGLQCHGRDSQSLGVGNRAALNLSGIDVGQMQRGDWVCASDAFLSTKILDVSLILLPDAPQVKNRDRVRLHLGTLEVLGRLMLFGQEVAAPGQKAFAQLILENEIMAARSDRFIIRRYSPLTTLGGGVILDPVPQRRSRSDPEVISAFQALEDASGRDTLKQKVRLSGEGGLTMAEARTLMNLPQKIIEELVRELADEESVLLIGTPEAGTIYDREVVQEARQKILARIEDYHRRFPQLLGMTQAQVISELSDKFPAGLLESSISGLLKQDLVLEKGHLRQADHTIKLDPELEKICKEIETLLESGGLSPPNTRVIQKRLGISELDLNGALSVMNQQGRIVRMADGSPWAMSAVRSAWQVVRAELSKGAGKAPSELRETLGSSRRDTITLLEYFDHIGLTSREEDLRFPGPNFDAEL